MKKSKGENMKTIGELIDKGKRRVLTWDSLRRTKDNSVQWKTSYVDVGGLPENRLEVHVADEIPHRGYLVVDYAAKTVSCFAGNGRRLALYSVFDN